MMPKDIAADRKQKSNPRVKKESAILTSSTTSLNTSRNRKRLREESAKKEATILTSSEEKEDSKRRCVMDTRVENRRQQFYTKTDFKAIDHEMFPTPQKEGADGENDDPMVLTSPTKHRGKRGGPLQEINGGKTEHPLSSHYQFRNIFTSAPISRASPLPVLSWADSDQLWKSMVNKETVYCRNSSYMDRHADLQPRMRSILIDWIMEVCEVYSLHRETFYLAVDYIDRYLSATKNIHKTRLQLVGVTALFIAAKLEEIYPPKLSDFAYVTDGACTDDEILSQELIMLTALKWSLSPITAISWLNVYLQTAHAAFAPNPSSASFFLPQYPQETFVHISQLLDLCVLDIESLEFSSGLLAASALYHFSSRELATQVSGFHFKDLAACVHWMAPFAITVRDTGLQPLKQFKRVLETDAHNIQTHANNIDTLDSAFENRSRVHAEVTCQSPTEVGGFMTPPKSGQKQSVPVTPQTGVMGT
ncbi:G1/S-specific cyclin-E1 isoform X1 [Ciona intestinalis]